MYSFVAVPRRVELAMAVGLLLLIFFHCKLHTKVIECLRGKRHAGTTNLLDEPTSFKTSSHKQEGASSGEAGVVAAAAADPHPKPAGCIGAAAVASDGLPGCRDDGHAQQSTGIGVGYSARTLPPQAEGDVDIPQRGPCSFLESLRHKLSGSESLSEGLLPASSHEPLVHREASANSTTLASCLEDGRCAPEEINLLMSGDDASQDPAGASGSGSVPCAATAGCSSEDLDFNYERVAQLPNGSEDPEKAALLQHCAISSSDVKRCSSSSATERGGGSVNDSGSISHRVVMELQSRWQALRQQAKDPAIVRGWVKLLCFGALAGFCAGVMGALTGMGGPPLLLLFEVLKIHKDEVRGIGAILNVLQVRIIVYATMGLFRGEEAWLYTIASVGSLLGLLVGIVLEKRVNQHVFSRILILLMLTCCLLMFASAAGLGGSSRE